MTTAFWDCCELPVDVPKTHHKDYHLMNDISMEIFEDDKLPIPIVSLTDMLAEQRDFQKNFYDIDNLQFTERVALTKEYILCSMRELGEALNTLPWKSHRKYEDTASINREELLEELTDVMKFVLNLYLIWDFDSRDLIDAFAKKSEKVRQRLSNEKPQ